MFNLFKTKRTYHRKTSLKRERESLECKADGTSKYCGKDKPLRPIIPYFGGKTRVADKIISKFPKNYNTYVEPFVGGGSVYWKETKAKKYVINDKNKEIYNLYKTAKNKPKKINSCKIKQSKFYFDKIKQKTNKSACDTITLHKTSFGALGKGYIKKNKRYTTPLTKEHKTKLSKTKILNEDFKKVANRYDKKNVIQYWDPPYVEQGKAYKINSVTPQEVCDTAKKLKKAKVIISYDNNSRVKKSCKGLKQKTLNVPYSADSWSNKGKKELLITNY